MSQGSGNKNRQLSLLGLLALVTGLGASLGLADFALRHVDVWGQLAFLLIAMLYGGMLGAIIGQYLFRSRRAVFLGFVCSGIAMTSVYLFASFIMHFVASLSMPFRG